MNERPSCGMFPAGPLAGNMREARYGRACRLAAVLVMMAVFPACVTPAPSLEEAARLSHWNSIDLIDVDLNIPILIEPRVTEVERRFREGFLVENKLQIEINKGRIVTVVAREASFDTDTVKQLASAEFFSARMIEAFDRIYDGHQEFREIRHKTRRSQGFAAIVNVKNTRRRCFFAIVGYRMKGGAVHVGDFGTLDTMVTMAYCDPKVTFVDFSEALESVEPVDDRDSFADALRRKVNAVPGGFRGGGRET